MKTLYKSVVSCFLVLSICCGSFYTSGFAQETLSKDGIKIKSKVADYSAKKKDVKLKVTFNDGGEFRGVLKSFNETQFELTDVFNKTTAIKYNEVKKVKMIATLTDEQRSSAKSTVLVVVGITLLAAWLINFARNPV